MIITLKAMLEVKRLLEELKNKYHNDKESLLLRIENTEQERDDFKVSIEFNSVIMVEFMADNKKLRSSVILSLRGLTTAETIASFETRPISVETWSATRGTGSDARRERFA